MPELRHLRRVSACAAAACAIACLAAATAADARTRVVRWSPFTEDGSLRAGLVATPRFGGDCWTGSFVVDGGYRCAAGDRLHDPCFADPVRKDVVVCVSSPFDRGVVRLRVSGSMDDQSSAGPDVAWGLRLASGLRCTFLAGGATGADSGGRRLNYLCRGSSAVLWGNPIRRGETWRIRSTRSMSPAGQRLVDIRTAYIGDA